MRAYPDLEARTGGVAAVATAVLPLFLDDRPLGVLILDFREPHRFTPEEIQFLRTLAAQSALALGRARLLADLQRQVEDRTRHLQTSARAQEAFVAFTEAVGTETDLLVLASQAIAVLRDRFPDAGLGYYTAEGDLWKARVWAEDMDRQLVRTMTAGLPGSTPLIRQAVASRTPVFTEAWDAGQQEIEYSGAYGAGSAYPLLLGGEVHALLLTGLRGTRQWSEADRALIRAVGRSLNLVLRRVAAAQQLQLQKEAAESRARALEAFARLSRDLVTETDRYALIRQAQSIVLSLLPPGAAVYYELTGGLWRVRAQVGEIGNARLQAVLDAGLPLEVPTLHTPWTTGEPFYQDEYAQGSDTSAEIIRQVNASAALLLRRAGQPIGVFTIGLFDQRVWTPVDRSVLGTVIQSLELALERAQNVEVLAERTAELEWANQELHLSNQELEAFTYSASHDLRTPVRHVRGFTEMAGRALDAGDPVRVRRHHGVVLAAADRMTDLIDAMLVLSRAGRAPVHRREVPLGALVSQAQRDVRLEFPEQPVSWRLGALPPLPELVVLGELNNRRRSRVKA